MAENKRYVPESLGKPSSQSACAREAVVTLLQMDPTRGRASAAAASRCPTAGREDPRLSSFSKSRFPADSELRSRRDREFHSAFSPSKRPSRVAEKMSQNMRWCSTCHLVLLRTFGNPRVHVQRPLAHGPHRCRPGHSKLLVTRTFGTEESHNEAVHARTQTGLAIRTEHCREAEVFLDARNRSRNPHPRGRGEGDGWPRPAGREVSDAEVWLRGAGGGFPAPLRSGASCMPPSLLRHVLRMGQSHCPMTAAALEPAVYLGTVVPPRGFVLCPGYWEQGGADETLKGKPVRKRWARQEEGMLADKKA